MVNTISYKKNLRTLIMIFFQKDLRNTLYNLSEKKDIDLLARECDKEMRALLDKHTPIQMKTLAERPHATSKRDVGTGLFT